MGRFSARTTPNVLELKVLLLLLAANGSPIVLRHVLGDRYARPLDAGWRFSDGRPLFGRSKTWRGVLAAVVVPALIAPLLGLPMSVGLVIGAFAMVGDLTSSFVKRRLGRDSGARAMGIDQVPESLLPTLVVMGWLGLSWWSVGMIVVLFVIVDVAISPLLFRLQIRPEQ
jgi:hypothetical protein